ncbi:MAG: tetratricopeptide repeat protein, partial [Deltaproteobacteria bacterium]
MNQWTIDVNEENFEAEVLERSTEVPVIVDFWAEWCGPCKMLAPALDEIARELQGQVIIAKVNVDDQPALAARYGEFILAKVNVDENQGLAGAFGIQGIPAVKLFKDGELASEFTGALPEPMLREFLSKFLPTAADKQAQEGQALEESGKTDDAKALYQEILAADPNHAKALLGLGRLAMNEGAADAALEYLDKIPIATDERKEADRLIARLNLQSGAAENETALREKAKAEPNNVAARFELAQALAATEKYEEALKEFLAIV